MKKNLKKHKINSNVSRECECSKTAEPTLPDSRRRNILQYLAMSIPILNLLTSKSAFALAGVNSKESELSPQVGDRLTPFITRDRGPAIKASALEQLAKPLLVLPIDPISGTVRDGSRFNQILLQKLPVESLSLETKAVAAEGIVAYTAICTHTGCPVTGWVEDQETYMCPCHQSVFSPKNMGEVVSGPAPRSLPSLPISIVNDEIVISANFNSWVGFGKMRN